MYQERSLDKNLPIIFYILYLILSKFILLNYNIFTIQPKMGCGQSTNQASEPIKNQSKTSAVAKYPVHQHQMGDFLILMVGNTATHGIILGLTKTSFIPIVCRVPIPRYCHSLMHDKNIGYITGGIEDLQANINQKATIDNQILEGTISKRFIKVNMKKLLHEPENSFEILPDMINARYAHCAIQLQNCLYVIGGRQYGTDQNGLLSACQRYDFNSNKWKATPSLQFPRAAATVIKYGQHIYIFGGYSGNNNRTRFIESYSDGDSSWRKLPFCLHEGLEGCLVIKKPNVENSILIFGGKTNHDKSKRIIEINFDKSCISGYTPMKQERSFHKGAEVNGQVTIIGGGSQNIQTYQIANQIDTLSNQPSFLEYCTMKQLNSFSQFQQSISLKNVKKYEGLPKYANRVCIFGHSHEPFAKIINTDNFVIISQGQSMHHNFYQYTNVTKVNKENCFVLGGLNADFAQVTNSVYSFNLLNNEIKNVDPMTTPRYAFASVVHASYLYAIGGRKLGDDDVAILNQCERFSFQTYQWQTIKSMKYRKQSALALSIGDYILVIGGYKGNGVKSNEIQMFIPGQDRWVQIETRFQLSVESMTPVIYNNTIYLFGGRSDNDIKKVFKLTIDLDHGVKFQKSVSVILQPVGNLSYPGTNLKVFVDNKGYAFVFGNIKCGVDVYDLNKHKIVQTQQLSIFQKLSDPLFQAYTLIY